jgi:hypothetical protein
VLILVLGLRKGEALGLIAPDDDWRTDEDRAVIDLEWQLQRVGGHPLTHKQVLKADGSTDTLPLPPICVTALRIAKRNQDQARTADWPDTCICGERHALVFTTRTGRPSELQHQPGLRRPVRSLRRPPHHAPRHPPYLRLTPDRARRSPAHHNGDLHPGPRQGDQGRTPAAE